MGESQRSSEEEGEMEGLCCCEYINTQGERSHLLMSFCDCEALDSAADRVFKRQKVPTSNYEALYMTLEDRLRIPWCNGRGAKQINPQVIPPLLLVPLSLNIAAIHPLLTAVVLVLLPILLIRYYFRFIKIRQSGPFFLSWGLVSVGYLYSLYYRLVIPLGIVTSTETCLLTVLMVAMLAALTSAKQNPGFISEKASGTDCIHGHAFSKNGVKNLHEESLQGNSIQFRSSADRNHADSKTPVQNGSKVGHASTTPSTDAPYQDDSTMQHTNRPLQRNGNNNNRDAKDPGQDAVIDVEDKKVVDRLLWCHLCKMPRPPRAGHCMICKRCVLRLDHHCIWIDHCVGKNNHRSFLLTLVLFMSSAGYGVWLSLNSTCPGWYSKRWIPYCPQAYNSSSSALVFTCCYYTLMVLTAMSGILVSQLINISWNMTGREERVAIRHKTYKVRCCGFCVYTDKYDKGCVQNWWEFSQKPKLEKPAVQMV
ncbi:palmitoyltransferase ZDHHC23-like isoform X1 [Branchiostoma lanceolatum]|uniref:palmitoyltransferase ZDHHC23-like isoform X1 n=1 Tax=Branchiostoma lanceolatum TaxID=7740 RepID=UPI003455FAA3